MSYESTKTVDGFSTVFRQWRATKSHCSLLHGYSIKFKLYFKADTLDDKNWVQDFGFLKTKFGARNTVKDWFHRWFDHTLIVAQDDPLLNDFRQLEEMGGVELRVLSHVGCEKFAQFVFESLQGWIAAQSLNRVRLYKVECIENEKNSASYEQ